MSLLATAFNTGLVYGLVLGALVAGLLFVIGRRLPPEALLRGYPPEVRARLGPIAGGSEARLGTAMLLLPIVFGTLAAGLLRLADIVGAEFGLVPAAVCTFAMLAAFNLFDLLVLDWLVFVWLRPGFVVLPGTGREPRWGDMGYHLAGFGRGLGIAVILAPIIGGIAAGVFAITG